MYVQCSSTNRTRCYNESHVSIAALNMPEAPAFACGATNFWGAKSPVTGQVMAHQAAAARTVRGQHEWQQTVDGFPPS